MHLGGTVPSQENLRTYSSDPLSPSSMAVASPSSSSTSTMVVAETKPERPSENAPLLSSSLPQPDPNDPNHLPSSDPLPPSSASSSSTTTTISSSSSPFPMITPSPPAAMAAGVVPPAAPAPPVPSFPSFRPVPPMPVGAPQFSPIPNPAIQPPGVAPLMTPVSVSAVRYPVAPQPYAHMSNGYPGAPMPLPVPLPSSMPPEYPNICCGFLFDKLLETWVTKRVWFLVLCTNECNLKVEYYLLQHSIPRTHHMPVAVHMKVCFIFSCC